MARLPEPGGDAGNWGEILNDFLKQEHNDDGTLKDVARPADLTKESLGLGSVANLSPADLPVSDAMQVELTRVPADGVSPRNLTPVALGHWRAAVARVRNGMADARVLCVGDSTTWGLRTADVSRESYPARLAAMLDSYHAPAAQGLVIPPHPDWIDPRWSAGGGWAHSAMGWGGAGCWYAVESVTTALTFTSGTVADTYDIYYMIGASSGILDVSIDGGTATSIDMSGTPGAWSVATVTANEPGVHILELTRSTGRAWIAGVDVSDSTARRICVGNAGVSGASADDYVQPASLAGIELYAPDLMLLMHGINDATESATTDDYIADMTTLIEAGQASGDVAILSVVPSQGTSFRDREEAYMAALQSVAQDKGCVTIDIFARFGDHDAANALGLMHDSLHPNAVGYADIAAAVFSALRIV